MDQATYDNLLSYFTFCESVITSYLTYYILLPIQSSKSTRTYWHESRSDRSGEAAGPVLDGVRSPGKDFSVGDISAHPRHKKQMKPHQVEGFNFLLSNLVSENPGGCILAHAPGSGKTFMLISFIQSFMAKYPDARPFAPVESGLLAETSHGRSNGQTPS